MTEFAQKTFKEKQDDNQTMQLRDSAVLADNRPPSFEQPVQKKANKTGLPDNLKSGMEALSGYSLDHVRVHYNSSKPAAVKAHAYAQGSDIHLTSGQVRHLPHELGHVVQQMEGRVRPTTSVGGVAVNDNLGLEREADLMGAKALQRGENASGINSGVADNAHNILERLSETVTSNNIRTKRKGNVTKLHQLQVKKDGKTNEVYQMLPGNHPLVKILTDDVKDELRLIINDKGTLLTLHQAITQAKIRAAAKSRVTHNLNGPQLLNNKGITTLLKNHNYPTNILEDKYTRTGNTVDSLLLNFPIGENTVLGLLNKNETAAKVENKVKKGLISYAANNVRGMSPLRDATAHMKKYGDAGAVSTAGSIVEHYANAVLLPQAKYRFKVKKNGTNGLAKDRSTDGFDVKKQIGYDLKDYGAKTGIDTSQANDYKMIIHGNPPNISNPQPMQGNIENTGKNTTMIDLIYIFSSKQAAQHNKNTAARYNLGVAYATGTNVVEL